jgi:hypothetical protein
MNRIEMAKRLFENPKLKARDSRGNIVFVKHFANSKYIRYETNNHDLELAIEDGENWEIVSPKLKEFTFGEMCVMYYNKALCLAPQEINSVVSGRDFTKSLSDYSTEELDGKWTINEIYE